MLLVWRRQWHPTPVLLPGKSQGWRNLVGYSPWGRQESDMTEWLLFQFSLSCIREGNGNPLQCSCLENPKDGEAWWAAVYGVTQSRTRLKRLSSSSSSSSSDQFTVTLTPLSVSLPICIMVRSTYICMCLYLYICFSKSVPSASLNYKCTGKLDNFEILGSSKNSI